MRKILCACVFASAVLLCQSCVNMSEPPQKTPLELAAIQSREFDAGKRLAFDAVMTVFQDLGYIILSADFNTGFITAKSPTSSRWMVMRDTKATAFVQEITPKKTKVRLNFVNSAETSSQYGQRDFNERPVEDPGIYQNAFTRIAEGIFVRTENSR